MVIQSQNIEINDQFKRALDLLENTSKDILITGRAGTGKSTLLDYFVNHTKKDVVVLAPTGVAAVNVQGQTIHSFFGFKPGITPDKVKRAYGQNSEIYKAVDIIIIDEVSMVRADLLDCVDKFLRLNGKNKEEPFGGFKWRLSETFINCPRLLRAVKERYSKLIIKALIFLMPMYLKNLK